MLIAHSMGSIISYEALRDLGREDGDFEVAHYVTIGSPLGFRVIQRRVRDMVKEERAYDPRVRTPSVVTGTWMNFADLHDPVAFDAYLADDFQPNRREVQVRDQLIYNDYQKPGTGERMHTQYRGLSEEAVARYGDLDLIIWPETTVPFFFQENRKH